MTQEIKVILKEGVAKAPYFSKITEIVFEMKGRSNTFVALATDEQIQTLKNDSGVQLVIDNRVKESEELVECAVRSVQYTRRNTEGNSINVRDATLDYTAHGFGNWGLVRHTSLTNNTSSATYNANASYTYNYDGTGVDVVMQVASMLDKDDPEFADAQGNSRIVELQWNSLDATTSDIPTLDYSSSEIDSHAESVAYCAVSNTYGWATGAAIYVWPRDQTDSLTGQGWDAIRVFHEQKVANGNTRPTIVIDSMMYYKKHYVSNTHSVFLENEKVRELTVGNATVPLALMAGSDLYSVSSRLGINWGMTAHGSGRYYPDADLTDSELTAHLNDPLNDYDYQDRGVALQDMIDAGVHHVSAAGNYQNTIVMEDHPKYNNGTLGYDTSNPVDSNAFYTTNRGNSVLVGDTIAVAALSSEFDLYDSMGATERLAVFSDRGERVDCCAAGENINMNLLHNGYYNASGTSFASPNIGGMAALVLQKYPDTTPRQLRKYFRDIAVGTDKVWDSGIEETETATGRGNALFYDDALGCRGYSGNIAYLDPSLTFDPRTLNNDPIVSEYASSTMQDVKLDYTVDQVKTKLDSV